MRPRSQSSCSSNTSSSRSRCSNSSSAAFSADVRGRSACKICPSFCDCSAHSLRCCSAMLSSRSCTFSDCSKVFSRLFMSCSCRSISSSNLCNRQRACASAAAASCWCTCANAAAALPNSLLPSPLSSCFPLSFALAAFSALSSVERVASSLSKPLIDLDSTILRSLRYLSGLSRLGGPTPS